MIDRKTLSTMRVAIKIYFQSWKPFCKEHNFILSRQRCPRQTTLMYFKILRCITLAMAGLQWSIKILANHSRYAGVENTNINLCSWLAEWLLWAKTNFLFFNSSQTTV